jgi:hypothetical protein
LKQTPSAKLRGKLVQELCNLAKKRLELVDQMDDLAKSTWHAAAPGRKQSRNVSLEQRTK